ncbi:dynamin family protein [Clostridium estertheticum]|uniref:dynamin family protein n=1 Tax=Clostridium estertheticum TaxID=238834 RepID=UPI001C0E5CB1|nr:dynamin family protein [Clostridium estertheticum]MBU3172534.1 dynamin family protein [Clostridium estertheticum]
MKTFDELKEEMELSIKELINEILIHIPESMQKKYSEDLLEDLQNEFYTVVVLGEFKRGKSTFVNSLLGENLLPVDVTPTTATINAMLWHEERQMSVYNMDGTVEKLELNNQYLKKYVAGTDFDPNTIQYIKVGMPSEILKNNVVLVDTPGVDDLNQQRVDVTYKFIPRADAVLFLLDATSPVRRTEKEFIEDNLLSKGIDKIMFIANFIDQIDEDELEEVVDDISDRLKNALGGREVQLFGISARNALEARINGDELLLEQSGILLVEDAMTKLIDSGAQTEEKISRYKKRFIMILNASERELESLILIESASVDELQSGLENISKMIKEEERRKEALGEYVRRQEYEMIAIVRKSVNHFGENLRNDILEKVEEFKGVDFKEFIEKYLPRMIKRGVNGWIEQNMGGISKMLQMLERELALGLSKHFNASFTKFNLDIGFVEVDKTKLYSFQIKAEDISRTPITAGVIAASLGAVGALMVGSVLLPFVGMAGYPFISKKMMQGKLAAAKVKLLPELNIALDTVVENFSSGLDDLVLSKTKEIKNACSETYDKLINSKLLVIQREIKEKQNLSFNSKGRIDTFNKSIDNINKLRKIINEGGM